MRQNCSASAMCDNAVILSQDVLSFRYQEGQTILARCANSLA